MIRCEDQFKIPEKLMFSDINWGKEPFKTSCFKKKFDNYLIKEGFLFLEKNDQLIKIPYSGFVNFDTFFFDENPSTKQFYLSYISEFINGKLLYINLVEFKEYDVAKESVKANFFLTIFNLFKNYLNDTSGTFHHRQRNINRKRC